MEPLVQGRRLGRFRLREKLALGGMAEIWAADDLNAGPGSRPLALKLLLRPFAKDPHFRTMFVEEVGICTQLMHPNIVEVYGAYESDGYLFQSMERIDGLDLRRVLSHLARAGRRFPIGIALFIVREIARALSYAHERQGPDGEPLELVHRDVSPHNIMLSRRGRVKVLDFGVARAAERMGRTQAGVVRGKIAYMAPEQALSVGVTPQTDIFATGVVLWEMLAMRRLFVADDDRAMTDRVVRADVPSILDINGEVPVEVADMLAQMLQQRAPNRPSTMRRVEQAMSRSLADLGADVFERSVALWLADLLERSVPAPAEDGDRTEPTALVTDDGAVADPTEPDAPAPMLPPEPQVESVADPTLDQQVPSPVALHVVSPVTPGPLRGDDPSTDPVRLPTRSEIVRAVEKQPTLPVPAASAPGTLPIERMPRRDSEADAQGLAMSVSLRPNEPPTKPATIVPAVIPRPAPRPPSALRPVEMPATVTTRLLSTLTILLAVLVVILAILLLIRG